MTKSTYFLASSLFCCHFASFKMRQDPKETKHQDYLPNEKHIKFPFKRKGLTSHNVKFVKCLLVNNNGQFKVDNKPTILHLFNHSDLQLLHIWPCFGHGSFGPHGSFQPNLIRRFGLMFNQSLAVWWGSVRQVWVCLVVRVACGGLIRVGREENLAWAGRVK